MGKCGGEERAQTKGMFSLSVGGEIQKAVEPAKALALPLSAPVYGMQSAQIAV